MTRRHIQAGRTVRMTARSPAGVRTPASRVPEITAYFWGVKALSTALGEATSDYLVHTIDPVVVPLAGPAVEPEPGAGPLDRLRDHPPAGRLGRRPAG
jgi:hypothetical protein